MSGLSPLSAPLTLPEEAMGLLAQCCRYETPCGDASVVWRHWGTSNPSPVPASPVVLLHGGSGSWTHWLRNIGALVASGRDVWVPDLPGFGDSAVPTVGCDADAEPVPLEQGLNILLGTQACDLVGFSFGGMVAGLVAAQFPARARRLVLVGAPGLGISPERAIRLRAWRHLQDAAEREAIHRGNLAALMLHDPQAITDTALQLHMANVPRDRMQGRSLSRTDALAQALKHVKCRVDAIYGAEDALYRGRMDLLEPVLRSAPGFGALQLMPACGHWVQFEQADAFNAALLRVLAQPV